MAATLRPETAGLVTLASNDLDAIWRLIANGVAAESALRDLLPAIVRDYGEAGAAIAADWYDEQRAQAGIAGRFEAIPTTADDRGSQALIGWALARAADDAALKALILGGTQRRIADHVRSTITQSSIADRRAAGWRRVGDGSSCSWCGMLIGRGAIYRESTVDFLAHDNCGCSAAPVWRT